MLTEEIINIVNFASILSYDYMCGTGSVFGGSIATTLDTTNWTKCIIPVLWIRIRMDPELFPGSGIIVPDLDPAKNERTDK